MTGIKVSLLDRETLNAAATIASIKHGEDVPDETIATRLYGSYLAEVGNDSDKLAECEFCLGRSPETLKACPYCREEQEPVPLVNVKGKDGNGKDGIGGVPKEAKTMAKNEKAEPKQNKLATVTKIGQAADAGLMTPEAAQAAQSQLARLTEKDLDVAVHEVQLLKIRASQGAWELGRKMADIFDRQLWKLRIDEKGKPKFRTQESFCFEELGFTPTHAWKLINVAKNFTADDVQQFGTGKLGLVLQAPEGIHPHLVENVKAGASKAEIAAEVRAANKGRAAQHRDGSSAGPKAGELTKAGVPAKKRGRKPGPVTKITVAAIEGRQTVMLYTSASVLAASGDRKGWEKATKVSQSPTCTVELENGVVQTFTVVEHTDGTLKLKIDTHRVEE